MIKASFTSLEQHEGRLDHGEGAALRSRPARLRSRLAGLGSWLAGLPSRLARLRPPRSAAAKRFTLLLGLLAALGVVVLVLPPPDLADAPRLVDQLGPFAAPAAVVVGALMMVALIPRTLVSVAWGALFGTVGGAAYALAGALLAAALGFAVGRLLGRDFVAERVRGRLARLDGWFGRQSVLGVVTVRLLPVGGFGLVSYGYGTTGARLWPYLLGSVLASVPSAFGYAAVGAAVANPSGINWFAIAPAGLGLIATTVIVTRWRRASRATPA
ncbi:VTT domain-containing protein [Actinomycetes bacterium KLBMP 9797]